MFRVILFRLMSKAQKRLLHPERYNTLCLDGGGDLVSQAIYHRDEGVSSVSVVPDSMFSVHRMSFCEQLVDAGVGRQ